MHIAIVEDDPATRAQLAEYIQRYTRQYGTTFQVDTFADGTRSPKTTARSTISCLWI